MKLFEWNRYKDEYYKCLGFVGELAEEMGSVPIIKKTANRELLKIMSPDGMFPSFGMKRDDEDIRKIILGIEEFLSKIDMGENDKDKKTYMLNSFLQKKNELFRALSQKQIYAAQGSNLIVRLTYIDDEKKEQMIGEPICIAKMDEEAKMNLCYLLLLVAAKLDDANKKNPVNGSYTKDYFRRRVSGYCKSKVMEEE